MTNDVLINIKADISSLKSSLSSASKGMSSLGQTTKKNTSAMKSALKGVGTAIAGAFAVSTLTKFAKSIVSTTSTFSDSILNVKALTGATDEEFKALNDTAIKFGSTTAHSASASADAMGYMALAGWNCQQIMDGLGGVLNLASAGGLDLASTSDYLTDCMSMFNMEAKESTRTADVWAKAQAKSNMSIAQLGESMKYAGATASSFGLDIEQTSAMLGIMANNGIKASQGGTSLKSILSRLASPTKAVQEGFSKLGISSKEVEEGCKDLSTFLPIVKDRMSQLTNAQKVQVAKQIAGSEAMSGFLAIVNASTDALPALTEELYNAGGFAEETAKTMESGLGGAFRSLQSAWEGLLIKLGQKIEAPLTELIQGIATGLNNLLPAIQSFWAKWGDLITAISTGIAVFVALSTIVSTVITVFGFLKSALVALSMVKSITGLFYAFGVALNLSLSPITLVIAGIAALIAVGVLLWKNWDVVKAKTIEIWESIKNFLAGIFNKLDEMTNGAFTAIKDAIVSVFGAIWDFIKFAWDGIKSVFNTVLPIIVTIVKTYVAIWKTVITTVMNAIKTVITTVWNALKTIIKTAINVIATIIKTYVTVWKTIITTILNAIKLVVSTVWKSIKTVIESVVKAVQNIVKNGFGGVKSSVLMIFNGLKSAVMNVWNGIGRGIQGVINGIISCINGMVRAMNKISFDVPDWIPGMGGKKFGFNLKEVPKVSWFQTGGIFTGASVIGVGENGDEAVVPLSNKSRMKPFADAVSSMITKDQESKPQDDVGAGVVINVGQLTVREDADVQKIAEELYRLQERKRRKRGVVYA